MKKWGSGEIGATYYYYHNDYGKLGKTFKTGEVKTKAAIAQILYKIKRNKASYLSNKHNIFYNPRKEAR
ncbi:hypothetical protein AB4X15_08180 [Peribacillus simplex]|uniref:hypothetical protein n=1 Tax=Peribacillus simplex TaxID=1478 RepID=UPI0034E88C68